MLRIFPDIITDVLRKEQVTKINLTLEKLISKLEDIQEPIEKSKSVLERLAQESTEITARKNKSIVDLNGDKNVFSKETNNVSLAQEYLSQNPEKPQVLLKDVQNSITYSLQIDNSNNLNLGRGMGWIGGDRLETQSTSTPITRCGCLACRISNTNNDTYSISNSLESGQELSLSRSRIANRGTLPVGNKPLKGNTYIDGLLWGGNYWSVNADRVITYSFWGAGSESFDNSYGNITTDAQNWEPYEIAAMERALTTWSDVANIKFVRVTDNDRNATLGFYSVDTFQLGGLGMFLSPGEPGQGIGYFNWEGSGWNPNGLQQGGYGFVTLIHEIGHGLGLAHPHDNGGRSSIYPGVASSRDTGNFRLNQGVWTTMSYQDGLSSNNLAQGSNYGYQGTPMAFDIAAVQHLYGVNTTYRIGNDTYTLPSNNASGSFYSAIWDAGGRDTITAAGINTAVTIDLREAPLTGENAGGYISSVDGVFGGYTIANGVTIEKAIGGSGNDRLIGNSAGNVLYGQGGNDTLNGGAGEDIFHGGKGADTFIFLNTESIDTIASFVNLEGDKIAVSASGFGGGLIQGFLNRDRFVIGSAAIDAFDRFIYDSSSGGLFYDVDGSGKIAQQQFARLTPGSQLTYNDIEIIA